MTDYLDLLHRTEQQPAAQPAAGPVTITGEVHPYAAKALASEADIVARAPRGERNDTLNRAWFRMGRHIAAGTLPPDTARDALAQAARIAGLDDKEIATVLRDDSTSAMAQAAAHPRTPPPLEELPQLHSIVVEPPADDELDAFWNSRDTLAHVHQFARARRVAPWATLGNVLARVVAATSPGLTLPPLVGGRASLNLFVGIIGSSGAGKGAAEAAAHDALDVGYIETRNPGSGEGIVHAYVKRLRDGTIDQHHERLLFQVPEIDTLAALAKRTGTTLMPLLRSAWSGEQLGFTNADPTRNVTVEAHRYRLTLVAGIQPGRAGALLDDSDGGTPQRFLWLPGTDPQAPEKAPEEPKPRTWSMREPIELGRHMTVPDIARTTIDAARLGRLRGDGDALDGHALLTRLKAAAALALLEQRHEITDDDWSLAGTLMAVSDATRSRVVAHRQAELQRANQARALAEADRQITVTETVAEKAVTRICRKIRARLGEDDVTWSTAAHWFSSSDRRDYFDDAIETMRRGGELEIEEAARGRVIRRVGGQSA